MVFGPFQDLFGGIHGSSIASDRRDPAFGPISRGQHVSDLSGRVVSLAELRIQSATHWQGHAAVHDPGSGEARRARWRCWRYVCAARKVRR